MPEIRKCIFCNATKLLFSWPHNNFALQNKWLKYLETYYPDRKVKKSSRVCYLHFEQTAFRNWDHWIMIEKENSKSRLVKADLAVPSVPPPKPSSPQRRPPNDKKPHTAAAAETPTIANVYLNSSSTSKVCSTPFTANKRLFHDDIEDDMAEMEGSPMKKTKGYEADDDYDPNQSFKDYHESDLVAHDEFEKSVNHTFSHNQEKPWTESKFIVPWSFLLWALSNCRLCGEKSNITVDRKVIGAVLKVYISCHNCGGRYNGCTSSFIRKKLYHLNYTISCAILFSGSLAAKLLRFFSLARIHSISRRTFFRHQKDYLNMTVKTVFERQQQLHISKIKDSNTTISIAGDARCDSMGHSAKYSSYTMMDVTNNKILTTQLIQTTGNSNAMEMRGFLLCMKQILITWKLRIGSFISDRHIQVRKYMRETHGNNRKDQKQPLIEHFIDIWHCAKSLKKDLKAAVKAEGSDSKLQEWAKAIINHMYWVPTSVSPSEHNWADQVEARWKSLPNHITNKHKHSDPLYSKCEHPKAKRGDKKKKYIKRDSTAYELLTDIVENKNRLKDIRQLSPQYQTSSLEAFHSVLNHFAPKMIHFHYDSQFTRTRLAGIHFNANSELRESADPGTLTVIYPKYKKGEATAKTVSRAASFDYVEDLFVEAFQFNKQQSTDDAPKPMSMMHRKPDEDRDALKAAHTSRFRKQ